MMQSDGKNGLNRKAWCEMPRYIDADALIERIQYSFHNHERVRIDTVTETFLSADCSPTIEARPVVRGEWVLKRLCACYERDATMASLFDGIGGFPYIWEQLNGKGSCLWASEIEEFPMAVTKLRFGG